MAEQNFFGDDIPNTVQINILPDVRYFVANQLAIGLGLSIRRTSFGDFSQTNTSIAPNLRYYITGQRHFMPFVQAGVSFLGQSSSSAFLDGDGRTTLDFGLGGNIFLTERVALRVRVEF